MNRKQHGSLLILAALTLVTVCSCATPNYPTGTIELKYYAPGPWPVTVSRSSACCDSAGNNLDLYYPTNLGANGFLHPILTWGNGTNSTASQYDYLLRHMASWGFVVIATEDKNSGAGQTILDGANFLVNANSNGASIFFNKLNVSQVGSFGHSQGATGAVNALIKSAGSITTVVPIELPAQIWCSSITNCVDTATMTSGTILFVDGSNDPISPPTQAPLVSGEQSIAAYYNAVPNSVLKAKGTLVGPSHNDVQAQPDCTNVPVFCINGVYGYLGYPTAWFMDRLQGDAFAHGAFVMNSGEMFSETKNWEFVDSNIP